MQTHLLAITGALCNFADVFMASFIVLHIRHHSCQRIFNANNKDVPALMQITARTSQSVLKVAASLARLLFNGCTLNSNTVCDMVRSSGTASVSDSNLCTRYFFN